MHVYLLDENMPSTVPFSPAEQFIHVLTVSNQFSDGDIWNYAIDNNLIIITKDVDFYYRYLSSSKSPKIIWFRTGNLKKKELYRFIERNWENIEKVIQSCFFLVVNDENLEVL